MTRFDLENVRKSFWKTVGEAVFGDPPARFPRDQIINSLDATLKRSLNGQFTASLVLFEIDRFRQLEETRNTAEVAHIIRALEERMISGPCMRDMVRRLGGGRFAIVPTPLRHFTAGTLENLSQEIQQVAAREIQHPTQTTQVSISIGYAEQSEIEGVDGDTLFEAANAAMIAAVKDGPSATRGFCPAMKEKIIRRSGLASDARQAISSGCIHAHFQPQVDTVTHQIVGLEALARWKHIERGMLSPAEFLPVLEDLGMMQDLGFAILRHALCAMRDWEDRGLWIPTMSVNMSTEELLNPNLVDVVQMELDAYNLQPDRLVIEILETVVAGAKEDLIMRNINALHELGCAIDLDDFGTGHASITTIRKFGVDRIKLDRSFVSNIGDDLEQQQMVLAILTMAQQLRVRTLAEGVETESELAFLSNTGCTVIQGYVVSRPMPQDEVLDWVRDNNFDSHMTVATKMAQ